MITFDEARRQANIARHGIDLGALLGFFDGLLLIRVKTHATPMASCASGVGSQAGEMPFVVWTPGDDEWREFISAGKGEKHKREGWTRFCNRFFGTKPEDWNNGFVTHATDELRKAVAARRTRAPNRHPRRKP